MFMPGPLKRSEKGCIEKEMVPGAVRWLVSHTESLHSAVKEKLVAKTPGTNMYFDLVLCSRAHGSLCGSDKHPCYPCWNVYMGGTCSEIAFRTEQPASWHRCMLQHSALGDGWMEHFPAQDVWRKSMSSWRCGACGRPYIWRKPNRLLILLV